MSSVCDVVSNQLPNSGSRTLRQVLGAHPGASRSISFITMPLLNTSLVMSGFFSTENNRWSGSLRAGSEKSINKSCPECSQNIYTVTACLAIVISGALNMLSPPSSQHRASYRCATHDYNLRYYLVLKASNLLKMIPGTTDRYKIRVLHGFPELFLI